MLMTWDGVVRFFHGEPVGKQIQDSMGMFCRDPLLVAPETGRRITRALTQSAPLCLRPAPCQSPVNMWSWKKWQTSWVPQEIASALLILTRLVTENAPSSYLGQTAKFVDTECQEAFLSTWYRLVLFVFKFKAILASDLWYFLPFPLSVGSDLFPLRSTSK